MFRQESDRLGVDQNAGPDMGSSQGESRSDGQAQGQGGIVDAAKEKIEQLASQARETASKQVESRFSTGKTKAAQTLESVAQTLKSSSQQLREQHHQDAAGKYADQAAQKLEEISRYLENASLNDVASRVEDFGRREPALFIGSAVALGFLGARFLRSSRRNEGEMRMRQGFQESAQQRGQQGDAEQRGQGSSGSWQGTGDRDVTPAPQREWTTVGSERQSNPNENTADRTGRA
jgi:hypothetical protein